MPILSICIPTYNRSELAYRCVKGVLDFPGDDIEVIVSDNGSQDDTFERLSTIKDSRLRLSRNTENKGVYYNCFKVLEMARSDFCLFLSDEDTIIHKGLTELIAYLKENPDTSFVSCNSVKIAEDGKESSYRSNNNQILNAGYEAYRFCFRLAYIGGIVYNKRFCDLKKQYDPIYFNADLAADICFKGPVYLMKEPVNIIYPISKDRYMEIVTRNGVQYFLPKERKTQFDNFVTDCLGRGFSDVQLISVCVQLLLSYVYSCISYVLKDCDYYNNFDAVKGLESCYDIAEKKDMFFIELFTDGTDYLSDTQKSKVWGVIKDALLSFCSGGEFERNILNNFSSAEKHYINEATVNILEIAHEFGVKFNTEQFVKRSKSANLKDKMMEFFSAGEYEKIIEMNCDGTHEYFYLGKSYMALKKYDLAIASMEKYCAILEDGSALFEPCTTFTHISSMYFHLGRLYYEKNDAMNAKHYLEKCVNFLDDVAESRHRAAEKLLYSIC